MGHCETGPKSQKFSGLISMHASVETLPLHFCLTTRSSDGSPHISASLSNYSVEVFSIGEARLHKNTSLRGHTKRLIGSKFHSNSVIVYTASEDGSIKLWDLRTDCSNPSCQFIDTSQAGTGRVKPLSSFDVSTNNLLLSAGTELFDCDAFILFWDARKANLLGGYWESHEDDITEVVFHSGNANMLASGSTDGLINIYDLTQSCEEDALFMSLNTESSVERLLWYSVNNEDAIASVLHPVELQSWIVNDALLRHSFSRERISNAMKRKSSEHCYVANLQKINSDTLLLLAGSNWHEGECVRGMHVEDDKLLPVFRLKDNKQRVRASWFLNKTELLITGGEEGVINLWSPDTRKE